jgi:amino acid adenylation domain-containing protein
VKISRTSLDGLSSTEKRRLLARLLRDEGHTVREFPTAHGQRALWFFQRLVPDSAAYNITLAARIRSPLDVAALQGAFQGLYGRHPQLRATFPARDGVPVHVIGEDPAPFTVTDAGTWSEDALRQRVREDAHRPFDLETGPVFRVDLYRRAEADHLLLVSVHHIVSDAASLVVLLDELGVLYDAACSGRPAALPPVAAGYREYVRWQEGLPAGPHGERLWAYWRDRLGGELPYLDLPTDRPRPPVQTFRGAAQPFALDDDLIASLRALAADAGVTLFTVLLAGFQVLLCRYSGQTDIAMGVPMAGRSRPEFRSIVGYFVNPVVLRVDLSADPPFREFLAQVRATVLGALDHQDFPFSLLVERLRLDRDPSRSPLFGVMFNMIQAQRLDAHAVANFVLASRGATVRTGGLELEVYPVELQTTMFDLMLTVAEAGGSLAGSLQYSTDLFDAATAAHMLDHYRTLLEGIVRDPGGHTSTLPLVGAAERHRLLVEWNDTARPFPSDRPFARLFEAQVARTPEAIAAACGGREMRYRALNHLANRVARTLVAQGVGRDVVVSLLADRGLDFLVAVLGVFKAGGAYLPLDPRHPPLRHAQILAQSRSRLVLTSRRYRPALVEALAHLTPGERPRLHALEEHVALDTPEADDENLTAGPGPGDLAYVIFTSGSTGAPKGAMVEQRGMVNHLYAKIRDLGLSAADVVAQTASQCFDISVWQMLAALAVGGRTLIVDDDTAGDPAALLQEVDRSGVTILEVVPSLMLPTVEHAAAAGEARSSLRTLRWLLPTGEALPPELCRQWFRIYPDIPLVNAYGPAECSDDVTHGFITAPPGPDVVHMPIGRPIANTRLYIVDRHLQPVPIGVVGELCVAGDGVGRGYLNDPARTAEAFLPDPFSDTPGARLYRTGDLARYRADGTIEFVGRRDHQVKVRGFRIELGEIEAVLGGHPGVRDRAVAARDDGPGRRRLVAYVVPTDGLDAGAGGDALRAFLRDRLPDYMVPSAFVFLPALPLTPNGKVDRRALPAPHTMAEPDEGYVAPRTDAEHTLAQIWTEVLGIERVGVHDNFFALGGDSIQCIRVLVRAGQAGLRLTPTQFFQHQTVAELAAAVGAGGTHPGAPAVDAPPAGPGWIDVAEAAALAGVPAAAVDDTYPLAPMQGEMLAHALRAPRSGAYVEQLSCLFAGDLDLTALRRAWRDVFSRHPALRTQFLWDHAGTPVQVVSRDAEPPWVVDDLAALAADEQRRRIDDYLEGDLAAGFDLSAAPLARFAVFRTGPGAHRFVWTLHHLLSDAWSGGLVLREVLDAYEAIHQGRAHRRAPSRPFREFVAWVDRQDRAAAAAFWRRSLDGARLPTPLGPAAWRPAPVAAYAEWRTHLTPETTRALGAAARAARVTPGTLAQAAWAVVLAARSGGRDVVLGVTTAGRPADLPAADVMVGLFINTIPLRVDVDPDAAPAAWLGRLHAAHAEARRYEFCAAGAIREWIGAPEDASLFDSVLRFQNFPIEASLLERVGSLRLQDVRFVDRWNYPITVVAEPGDALALTVGYDPLRVAPAEARRMLDALAAALAGLAVGSAGRIAELLRSVESHL